MPLALLEALEYIIRRHRFRHHERRVQNRLDGGRVLEQVLRVHVPDGLVDVSPVDDNLAEAFRDEQFPHLIKGRFQVHGDDLVSWDQAVAS